MTPSLRRYTELPFLIDFLQTGELTLLSPSTWDDRNDAYYLERYLEIEQFKTAYVLCLAEAPETYHHWKVFSQGPGGVCIEFRRETFLEQIRKVDGLVAKSVEYRTINELREVSPSPAELPFLKRYAFKDESEFRVFLTKRDESDLLHRISMPLGAVQRITLSPWLPRSVSNHVKETLKNIPNCRDLEICRSTLVENENWKKFAACGV